MVNDTAEKSYTDTTDENGQIVVPPLSEDMTDSEGKAKVNGYNALVTDETKPNSGITDDKTDENGETTETIYNVLVEDTKGKIENAYVEVKDGKISVKLPDTHTLTTSNQTTVTVTDKDNNKRTE